MLSPRSLFSCYTGGTWNLGSRLLPVSFDWEVALQDLVTLNCMILSKMKKACWWLGVGALVLVLCLPSLFNSHGASLVLYRWSVSLCTTWILIGMGEWIWVWTEVSVKGRKALLVLGEEISYLWVSAQATNVPWLLGRTETYMVILCVWVGGGVTGPNFN